MNCYCFIFLIINLLEIDGWMNEIIIRNNYLLFNIESKY